MHNRYQQYFSCKLLCVLVAVLLQAGTALQAQNFPNLQFSHLPVGGQMTKGKDGLLYIATGGDVVTWDGFRTKKISFPLNEENEPLKAERIIVKDSLIWTTQSQAANVYNKNTGNLISYNQTTKDVGHRVKEQDNCLFFKDHTGQVYLQAGLLYRVKKDFSLEEVKPLSQQMESQKFRFDNIPAYEDRQQNLWIFFANSGLARLKADKSIDRFYPLTTIGGTKKLGIYEDKNGKYWIYGWYFGLQLFDTATGVCTPQNKGLQYEGFGTTQPNVYDMCEWTDNLKHDWLVMASNRGLCVMDETTFATKHFYGHFSKRISTSPSTDEQSSLYVDDEHILWINSLNGIDMAIPQKQTFSNYSLTTNYQFKTAPFVVGEYGQMGAGFFSSLDGNIWVGDGASKGVGIFTKEMGFAGYLPSKAGGASLSPVFASFRYAQPLHNDQILFTVSEKIGVWNKKKNLKLYSPEEYKDGSGVSHGPQVFGITAINQDKYLIISGQGIFLYDNVAQQLDRWLSIKDLAPLAQDLEGFRWVGFTKTGLWILCNNALFKIDPTTKNVLQVYSQKKSQPWYFPASNANKFTEDAQGNLWITCNEQGLLFFDQKTNQFISFKNKYNLPANVSEIVLDKQQRLWLSSENNNSLACFVPTEQRTYLFNLKTLAPVSSIFSLWQDSTDGRIWVGAENFLTIFHPDSVLRIPHQKQVYVAAVLQGDSAIALQYGNGNLFSLPHDKSTVTIQAGFHYLNRVNPPVLAFRLRANEPWKYSKDGNVTFYNLAPDQYKLQLAEAFCEGNVLEDNILTVYFSITPPFYETGWFLELSVLIVAGIAIAIFLQRINALKAKAGEKQKEAELLQVKTELEKQLAESEMAALRSQMNPHFIFNVLNSINKFILTADTNMASNYLTNFARLIRLVLENSKSSKVPLEADLEALELYINMEKMRFGNKFASRIEVDKNIDQQYLLIPPLLIQPYVENAIWHGIMQKETNDGKLSVQLSQPEDNMLVVTITDNGIGRKQAAELKSKSAMHNKSFGMQITKDRIGIVNKLFNIQTSILVEDLTEADGRATGTRVTLRISV